MYLVEVRVDDIDGCFDMKLCIHANLRVISLRSLLAYFT